MGGTGRREPRGIRSAAAVGGGFFGPACDKAVSPFGVLADTPLAEELLQGIGDSLVPSSGTFPDLALREGRFGFGEGLEDAPFGCFGLWIGLGGIELSQGGPLSVVGELDLEIVEAGGGAMFGGHEDLPVTAFEVEIAVSPGVQLGASSQGLPGSGGAAFAGVVDEQDRGLEASLDVAQEAEDGGDLGDGIFVDAVEADEGVENEEAGPDALHGLDQALAVGAMIEAQGWHVDDGDVEGLEAGVGGAGDALQAGAPRARR